MEKKNNPYTLVLGIIFTIMSFLSLMLFFISLDKPNAGEYLITCIILLVMGCGMILLRKENE